ncbi:endolytic transglycosylase MltG [Bacillaceae bacterium SIJ1]|uniref:endolytic transglycosylase MltG n=1 Tax=Litoribacterium kuwaitense TaxID=1398745 RepID=UPI0013EC5E6C|nr:endolytic transglycosylase MltG [Litoribacterium kuwaitense]NGP43553.1 endolytic transglycosylase MltG [Litoribacterium kuwaitense]
MKYSLRAFAGGILFSICVLLVFTGFSNDLDMNDETVQAYLAEQGQKAVPINQSIDDQVADAQEDNDPVDKKHPSADDDSTEKAPIEQAEKLEEESTTNSEKEVPAKPEKEDTTPKKEWTITISEGMTTGEVSQQLEDLGLLKANILNDYLEDNDMAQSIQIGEHIIKRGMNVVDIANEITN